MELIDKHAETKRKSCNWITWLINIVVEFQKLCMDEMQEMKKLNKHFIIKH